MNCRLVITEKPSVAQSVAAVIGAKTRRDGYWEGGGYRVSWCMGHLAGLADAQQYDPKYTKWRYDDLPILPQNWKFVVDKNKKKQYDVLHRLLNDPQVTEVINACDAGREGEAIFRTVYELTGCRKPMKRLWISSMEDEAIRKGFSDLRPGSDYDGLHHAALCRNKADWLVGINATRLFSVLYGRTLNIGRVMSPTLALLVQREADISAFQPESFYNVVLALTDFTAVSERFNDAAAARGLQVACADNAAVVQSVERKEKSEKAPALYDLTTLQREANRLLGYTAQQTLDYVQSLYEKKLCTYPRTDSRFLTSDMAAALPVLVNLTAKYMPFAKGIAVRMDAGRVINDGKVSDHHAIIPTRNIQNMDRNALTVGERSVLELICLRLLCAGAQPYEYAETTVTLRCADHTFTAKGRAILNMGWKQYEQNYRNYMKNAPEKEPDSDAKNLPIVTEGQSFAVMVPGIKEGKTTPPKHFTEDSLLSAMETAGVKDMPEDAERKGLGTPATRAGILEKLVSAGFVERKKSKKTVQLIPTQAAVSLITVLPEQLQSPLLTADWEYRLKEIERGEAEPERFMAEICAMLQELVSTYRVIQGAEVLFPTKADSVGICPRCGGQVAEMPKGFLCQSPDCKFAIWKNSRFFAAKRKTVAKPIVQALLKDGRVKLTGCYSEKTGRTYDATVIMADNGEKVDFSMEFAPRKGGRK
ncbi:MAG: DNA topoisomerase 3 [Oscillospiraceae bacterium]|nr:DNA topoisomerase 3 [Oscillospiraceae bacterium]